ncbi:hypothetical protein AWJ20_2146 [Sugiyamaella lignohabitans]|uniref:Uncharacterized protein n=1 Tax=Sugiyamaella lignohabitans TaxID=796027 RepID=A0A167EWT7_9ASCO|nr:uncharacterized protein AWJ20_2146 [Sugiyamaella lignohabitans]ANB14549.1 hypothetical protein AWJ20_2146 [Sugiyamaella lignohabitans]
MDRFCSAATGWNTSLTSSDVKRRLPVEGTLWRDEYDGKTPYFNISQNSLNPVDDMNALGGYAYLVEATEFLDRIVNFLRRESVDFSSSDDGFSRWFNVFQELDSMLVRWKASLPEKWQVSRVHSNGWMDQNLTLAHVTHNASVILLHQNLAYATPDERIQILSSIASETCLTAASEIATIAKKFLYYTENIVAPQFCLCIFIAARALLAHSEFFDSPLKGEFDSLLSALKEGSKRWPTDQTSQDNLAKQFMDRLEAARDSHTALNVRSAAFEDEAKLSFSFPQFPDINGILSLSNSLEPTQYLQELDRIVLWDDGVAELE